MHRPAFAAVLLLLALVVPGCWGQKKLEPTPVKRAPETVRLLVPGDPALAEAIRRLKGEWHAVSGNSLEVIEQLSLRESNEKQVFDALIIPAIDLGDRVATGGLVPVPADLRDDPAAAWSDFFLLVQQGVAWGDNVWGVPLGQPQLTLLYRRDLFERFKKSPPTTWAEYQALVKFFAKRENLGDAAPPADQPWHATLEPTAPEWAGRLLLARAAAYAKHRDNFSTLLNIDTMEPLIAGEPFVRALTELVAAAGRDAPRLDPAGVREAFFAGQSAMALTWPTAAKASASGGDDGEKGSESDTIKVGFAELPGATQMFNFATGKWDTRNPDESVHVPVVPLAGLTGVVSKNSHHAMAAFELLIWLSGEKWGTRVAGRSDQTTLFRRSQLAEIGRWVEPGIDRTAARQYGQVVSDGMSRSVWVDGLRIRGSERYYLDLGEAVASALEGTQSPADALSAAAEKWRQTTERVGLDVQKASYRRSLGLDP